MPVYLFLLARLPLGIPRSVGPIPSVVMQSLKLVGPGPADPLFLKHPANHRQALTDNRRRGRNTCLPKDASIGHRKNMPVSSLHYLVTGGNGKRLNAKLPRKLLYRFVPTHKSTSCAWREIGPTTSLRQFRRLVLASRVVRKLRPVRRLPTYPVVNTPPIISQPAELVRSHHPNLPFLCPETPYRPQLHFVRSRLQRQIQEPSCRLRSLNVL